MDKIKIHNEVTVKNGDSVQKYHNEMYPFFHLTGSPDAPCSYCKIGCSDGSFVTLKTTISSYDFSGESDEKFCEYAVVATDDDLPSGKVITSLSLAPNPTFSDVVNFVSLTPTTKSDGVSIEIGLKLILSANMNNCAFTPGNNMLVACLLGASTFYGSSVEMMIGLNDHPLSPISRDSEQLMVAKDYCGFSLNPDSISFSLNSLGQGDEVVVLINGKSVLRGCYYGQASQQTRELIVPPSKMMVIDDRYFTAITSLTRLTNNKKLVFEKKRLFGGATSDCEKIIDFTLPSSSVLVGEPSGVYFAVADNKQVRVYKFFDRQITHCYSVERWDEEISLVSNGSLFIGGNKGIMAHYYDGQTVTSSLYYTQPITNLCVIYGGGCYRVGYYDEYNTYYCDYDYSGMVVASDTVQFSDSVSASAVDENTMIVASSYGSGNPLVCGASNTDYGLATKLINFYNEGGYYPSSCYNGWIVLYDAEGTQLFTSIYDLNSFLPYSSDATYEFINSEMVAIYRGGIMEELLVNNKGSLNSVKVQNLSVKQPDQIIVLGNYLMLRYGDKIDTLYLTRGGWRLKALTATSGETVLATGARLESAEFRESNEYKIEIKLEQ